MDGPGPNGSGSGKQRSGLRILAVDDDPDTASSMKLLLDLDGHETVIARDGPAALEIAKTFLPDVVLLDLGLPRMDGHEVARRLRALSLSNRPLLVALTGHASQGQRLQSAEAGLDVHLVKPVQPEALLKMLAAVAAKIPWIDPAGCSPVQ